MSKKNWSIFYPLLLGIYSALGLVSVTISQMVFSAGVSYYSTCDDKFTFTQVHYKCTP